MKRIEITYNSIANELDKLNTKLTRAQATLEKKRAVAEKMGVADMSGEEHTEWLNSCPTENGWLVNKADIKKNGAWFDLFSAEREVKDIAERIANAERRFAKAEEQHIAHQEKVKAITDLKAKEELAKLEFEQEQKEWARDGIRLEARYYGTTPSGKHFQIWRNSGFTERSLHCFTLYVDGEMIFSSGEFWRAYGELKRR